MNPNQNNLLRDLLHDETAGAQRAATLQAGTRILRRKRRVRFAIRGISVAGGIILAILVVRRTPQPDPQPVVVASNQTRPMKYLTDDELLALFPGTPVGLGTVNGRTILIFPRDGDEARFISRGL
jgi:hypothetical protein